MKKESPDKIGTFCWVMAPLEGDGVILADMGDEQRICNDRFAVVIEHLLELGDASLLVSDLRSADIFTDIAGLQGELLTLLTGSIGSINDTATTPSLGAILELDMGNLLTSVLADLGTSLGHTAVNGSEGGEARLEGTLTPRHLIAVGINALTVLIQIDSLAVHHRAIMETQH